MDVSSFLLLLLIGAVPDATPPRVTIAVPTASSTVSRIVHVHGDVKDDRGIVKTELYTDGVLVAATADPKAFALTWDSSKARKGAHTLLVKAYDAASDVGSASVQVHLRHEFDVGRFGAKGDGKTDDTAAIQRALDAARKAGGGTVWLPKGTYAIQPGPEFPCAVGSNTEVRGEGPASVLKVADDAGDYNFIFGQWNADPVRHADHVENVGFRHFRVDQNPAGNKNVNIREDAGPQNVLQFHGFKNLTVQDVHFDVEPGVQAVVLAGPKAEGVTIDGCYFRFVRGHSTPTPRRGRFYDHSSVYTEAGRQLIRNNRFESEKKKAAITAIEVHGGPHVTVTGNRADGFQVGIVVVNSTASYPEVKEGSVRLENNQLLNTTPGISLWSLTGRTLRRVVVHNNRITMARHELYRDVWLGILLYDNADDAESAGDFEGLEITGNTIDFRGLTAGALAAVGIDIAPAGNAKDVVVKNNTVHASPATGIRVGNARTKKTVRDARVEGNTIVDAGWDTTAKEPLRAAVFLDRAPLINVLVQGNTIEDTGKPGKPRGQWSIWAFPGPTSMGVRLRQKTITPPQAPRYEVNRKLVDDDSAARKCRRGARMTRHEKRWSPRRFLGLSPTQYVFRAPRPARCAAARAGRPGAVRAHGLPAHQGLPPAGQEPGFGLVCCEVPHGHSAGGSR